MPQGLILEGCDVRETMAIDAYCNSFSVSEEKYVIKFCVSHSSPDYENFKISTMFHLCIAKYVIILPYNLSLCLRH